MKKLNVSQKNYKVQSTAIRLLTYSVHDNAKGDDQT